MITLKILLAEANDDEAKNLEKAIGIKLDQQIEGVKVEVQVVKTLVEVLYFAQSSNVILIDLHLADAGPDEVISVLGDLPEPVIVITDIIDPAIHAQCKMAGALVVVKSLTRNNEIYHTILHCLGKSVAKAAKNLP
jgi:CheY-like chemotaxis protein